MHAQACPIPCYTVDCGSPDSSPHGVLQARYWSGLSFPPPGDRPRPGIKPTAPAVPAGRQILYQRGNQEAHLKGQNLTDRAVEE